MDTTPSRTIEKQDPPSPITIYSNSSDTDTVEKYESMISESFSLMKNETTTSSYNSDMNISEDVPLDLTYKPKKITAATTSENIDKSKTNTEKTPIQEPTFKAAKPHYNFLNFYVNNPKHVSAQKFRAPSGELIKPNINIPLAYCRRACKMRIPFEQQKKLFDYYWSLQTMSDRTKYLQTLIEINKKKSAERLSKSYDYYIEINGKRLLSCQKCMLQIFGETMSIINRVLKHLRKQCQEIPIEPSAPDLILDNSMNKSNYSTQRKPNQATLSAPPPLYPILENSEDKSNYLFQNSGQWYRNDKAAADEGSSTQRPSSQWYNASEALQKFYAQKLSLLHPYENF